MAVSTAQAKLQHDTDLAGGPPPTSLVGEKEFSFGDFVVDFWSFFGGGGGWGGVVCCFLLFWGVCVCVFFLLLLLLLLLFWFVLLLYFRYIFFSFSYFVEYVHGPLPQIETRDQGTATEGRRRRKRGVTPSFYAVSQSVSQSISVLFLLCSQ